MQYYIDCLKKYAVFTGRSRRKEFWMFVLFNAIAAFVINVISGLLGSGLPSGLYSLAVLVPSLAVCARRLHDTGRSGWWQLVALIPFLGTIVLIVFCCQDSQSGANQFGDNPKNA